MGLFRNVLMAIAMTTSVAAPLAHAEVTQQITAKQYLQTQLAELQDLKEQLAAVNQKKSTTKIVLYVSAGAMAAGPVLALMQIGGNLMGVAVKVTTGTDITAGKFMDKLILEHGSQIGAVMLGAGAIGAVSSGGYLIYLNMTQSKELEKQIAQLELEIQQTAGQLK
ncbi:MAG: hypothetical protein ACKOX6_14365 [Bdellovibrio sp.]